MAIIGLRTKKEGLPKGALLLGDDYDKSTISY